MGEVGEVTDLFAVLLGASHGHLLGNPRALLDAWDTSGVLLPVPGGAFLARLDAGTLSGRRAEVYDLLLAARVAALCLPLRSECGSKSTLFMSVGFDVRTFVSDAELDDEQRDALDLVRRMVDGAAWRVAPRQTDSDLARFGRTLDALPAERVLDWWSNAMPRKADWIDRLMECPEAAR